MKKSIAVILFLMCSVQAHAFDYAYVTDMSQLQWQMTSDGRVYLRNLNQFNANFLGCCYNYWIDTTTTAGKAMWAAVLLKIGTAQPLYLGFDNPAQPGQIAHIGKW